MGTDQAVRRGCHNKDQPHKFERKDMLACERCHGESVWKPAKRVARSSTTTTKDAAMPLLGIARATSRAPSATPKTVFNLPFAKPDSCGNCGCHQSPHDGHLFGTARLRVVPLADVQAALKQACKSSITPSGPSSTSAAHKKLKCYDCHTKALGERKPDGACEDCHAKDNQHEDRFNAVRLDPPKCATCHPSASWKPDQRSTTTRTRSSS